LLRLPEVGDNAAMEAKRNRRFQFSLRSLLIVVTLFCAAVWLVTIGVSYGTAEVVAWTIIACVLLLVVVRSAYRDACRRQRWPGKSREIL
jgi:Flp pilus assembly protein TadB